MNVTKISFYSPTHLQRKMIIFGSETIYNMTLFHFKILLWKPKIYRKLLTLLRRDKLHGVRCKMQGLKCPIHYFHISRWLLCCSFQFLNTALTQLLFSSFGTKWLSFMIKQILCFIPLEYSAYNWDFLMVTVKIIWLIWYCSLTDKTIRISSATTIISFQWIIANLSQNSTYNLQISSSGSATLSSFT